LSEDDMMRIAVQNKGWRGAAATLAASLACVGLAACGGSKDNAASGQAAASSGAAAPAAGAPVAGAAVGPNGQQIYQRCAVCHQATGLGMPGAFPPLAGSEWATAANAAVPIRVVLHGLQGAVTVKGQKFNSMMPAYGTNQPLSDAEVAAVMTYVRSAWGNAASAVTAEQVAAERAATASRTTMWAVADLQPLLKTGH
jgi:mono/diheme cytochrome c family protein